VVRGAYLAVRPPRSGVSRPVARLRPIRLGQAGRRGLAADVGALATPARGRRRPPCAGGQPGPATLRRRNL